MALKLDIAAKLKQLQTDGYCVLPDMADEALLNRTRACVEEAIAAQDPAIGAGFYVADVHPVRPHLGQAERRRLAVVGGRHQIVDFGDFILANVYFTNGRMSKERLDYKLAYYDAFLEFADGVRSSGRNLIFCGDVNTAHKEIDLARPKANEKTSGFLPIEREWMDKLVDHGFVDTFRMFDESPEKYSWWSQRAKARERNVGWRLDYFFVNEEFTKIVKRSWIMADVTGSDHCPVALELDL